MAKKINFYQHYKQPAPTRIPVEHHCDTCGQLNAMFGYGGSELRGIPGKWYCRDCRPVDKEQERAA